MAGRGVTPEEVAEHLAGARRCLAGLDAGQPSAEPLRRLWRRRVAELEDLRRALGPGREDRDTALTCASRALLPSGRFLENSS